jgi:geranyl-CoA carboxylase alpha subunit
MVKAAAGGGGRGMRFVHDQKLLPDAIKDARSEAANAFGSDILILERAVETPRHVEIQVFADKYGHTIHLGERDCSVQRRHQKVLEEAPCPVMTDKLRAAMGAAAVKAAKDIGYVGAGTVEFMLAPSGEFFFLEMNTRLQVEHPVTEMVTGLDLVALQIGIAQGEQLKLKQEDVELTGHAIEARLYAEDPASDFLPATGPIHLFKPASGDGIRIDSGIETGGEVSPFYDPMIAKVIAYGPTREAARSKLVSALEDTAIFGLKTNKAFLIDALTHTAFAAGEATTAFIGDNFSANDLSQSGLTAIDAAICALTQFCLSRDTAAANSLPIAEDLINWSSASKISTPFQYGDMDVRVTPLRGQNYEVKIGDTSMRAVILSRSDTRIHADIDGVRKTALFHAPSAAKIDISIGNRSYSLTNSNGVIMRQETAAGAGTVTAPMHGALLEIFVNEGDHVTKDMRLAILEAMKMQHEILAGIDGTVASIHVKPGTQIAADTIILEIEEEIS